MLKISDEHAALFESLNAENQALKGVVRDALQHAHAVSTDIVLRGKALWEEMRSTYGIEGEWRYENGKLVPVPQPQHPNVQGAALADIPQSIEGEPVPGQPNSFRPRTDRHQPIPMANPEAKPPFTGSEPPPFTPRG